MSKTTKQKGFRMHFDRPLEDLEFLQLEDDGKAGLICLKFSEDVDVKSLLRELKPKPDSSHRSYAAVYYIFNEHSKRVYFCNVVLIAKIAVHDTKDTSDFPVNQVAETFPQNFHEPAVFERCCVRERRSFPIQEDRVMKSKRLAIFREDIVGKIVIIGIGIWCTRAMDPNEYRQKDRSRNIDREDSNMEIADLGTFDLIVIWNAQFCQLILLFMKSSFNEGLMPYHFATIHDAAILRGFRCVVGDVTTAMQIPDLLYDGMFYCTIFNRHKER
ncbi:hypothetical protein CVS40_12807 [Lucilia cuprina]|nr:hypothetical protein CVS40_12807 [Lucilia cuprina]